MFQELEANQEAAAEELIPDNTVDNNTAPRLSRAKVRPRNQVGRKLKIPNLQQMHVLQPQPKVVSIPDEDNPDEEWDIVVKELTPGEYVLLHQTAFMRDAEKSRQKIEDAGLDPDDNDSYDQVRGEQTQVETMQTLANYNDYQIEVCLLGIVEPEGLTKEIISQWSRSNVQDIFDAIMVTDDQEPDVADAFPDEDTGSGTDNGGSDDSSGE